MTHEDVWDRFRKLFPSFAKSVKDYFPCGKNVIRIRIDDSDYVFGFFAEDDWTFETVKSFTNKLDLWNRSVKGR